MPLGGYAHATLIQGKKRYHHGKVTPKLKSKLKAAHKEWMRGGKYEHPQGPKKVAKKVGGKKLAKKKVSKLGKIFGKRRA